MEFTGQRVVDILRYKKASIKQARLPQGPPDWDEFSQMMWEGLRPAPTQSRQQVEDGERANRPGFKVVRKLLTDKRFDK